MSERLALRTISKETDSEGRSKTASAILDARAESRQTREKLNKNRENLHKTIEIVNALKALEEEKKAELLARQRSALARMKSLLGISDSQVAALESEVNTIAEQKISLKMELSALEREIEVLSERNAAIPKPADLLQGYYEIQAHSPLSLEQKKDLLQPELLAELSTEQYIALWRKLNPHFLAHVTRQGFRDHNMMLFHSAGMREFHNGFVASMQDNRMLKSPMVVRELPNRSEESIRQWLSDILTLQSKDEALRALNARFHVSYIDTPRYADSSSIHFAAQDVAHTYYGAEHGNEIFFVFPTDVIASQYDYAFHGGQHDFTRPQSELKWNDVFVWPKNMEQGNIPLDTGFVFLPKETPVDPETGSKYASEVRTIDGKESRVLRESSDRVKGLADWARQDAEAVRLLESLQKHRNDRNQFLAEEALESFQYLLPDVLKKMGYTEDMIGSVTNAMLDRLRYEEHAFSEEIIRDVFEDVGALFLQPEQSISAQQYWTQWFDTHPSAKPKHIVFYDGDPTTAVFRFLLEHNIGRADTSATHGKLLGFEDHYVADMYSDPRASRGQEELLDLCRQVIQAHFEQNA